MESAPMQMTWDMAPARLTESCPTEAGPEGEYLAPDVGTARSAAEQDIEQAADAAARGKSAQPALPL